MHVRLDDYTETGAGDFDLDVDSTEATILTGTPWLKVGRQVANGDGGHLNVYAAGGISLLTGEDFETTARLANAADGIDDFTTSLDN